MRNIIVGTAGHIDHGKTALVKALTGTDADRLAEEKRRGITIDLGFAHLQLSKDLRLGFIDVPGHERFVRNMLAGAAGIDLVLFVISALESVKPQTREHFEICRMLGVKAGVIAITKADLADPEMRELTQLDVNELVADSFLEHAPRVEVSAITGEGIPELHKALECVSLEVEHKKTSGWTRLPLDRAFTMKGFGTVATGTLISGTIALEQELEVYPIGHRVRVRGIQVYGETVARAHAGERTAVNLTGIDPAELHRGMILSEPGRFAPVTKLDCRVDLLQSAKPLKNRAPVHFHIGAAETEAVVHWLDRRPTLQPGESAWARITLKEPALVLPGDRFIVRMFSPVTTIGGGVVRDISAHNYRKGEDASSRLGTFTPETLVLESPHGVLEDQLIAWTGSREIGNLLGVERTGKWLIAQSRVAELAQQLTARCAAFHRENSLLPGIPKQDLKAAVMPDAPAEVFEHVLTGASELVRDGEVVRLKTHRVALKNDEEEARAAIEKSFEDAGLTAPAVSEVLKTSGVEPARGRAILQILLREGKLIRISADLILAASVLRGLRNQLSSQRGQRFSVPTFKDWTGVSRKYAIPLLEYLDRERVTRRDGEERILL